MARIMPAEQEYQINHLWDFDLWSNPMMAIEHAKTATQSVTCLN